MQNFNKDNRAAEAEGQFLFQHELKQHVRNLISQWCALLNKNQSIAVFLALEICKSLQKDKNYALLEMFLNALPENEIYGENEEIVRAKISIAYETKNFQLVYELIEKNQFQNGDDLVEIWDNAHYGEEFERTKKPLSALNRFRIRERFLPPETICPGRERRKASLGESSRHVLQQWLDEHRNNPYPSKETKEYLSKKANITPEQVKTWFANARRRLARMQGKENRRVSWQRYSRKRVKEKCHKHTGSSTSLEEDDKCKIIEPNAFGQKEDLIPLHDEDSDSMSDMTVSMSDNSEITSRPSLSPISSFTSPGGFEGIHTRLVCALTNATDKPEEMRGLPDNFLPLELVEPPAVVNPSLHAPTPLTYYYDYYSSFPFQVPCCAICNSCFYQLNSSFDCQDAYLITSEKTWPSNTLPCESPANLQRSRAACALLDLSSVPRMPRI